MSARRVAVLAHGTGSDAGFLRSSFRKGDLEVDEILALDDPSGDVDVVVSAIDTAVNAAFDSGNQVRWVGGVSLGAHASALWAAEHAGAARVEGLLLVFPAWTGPPGAIAGATAHTASAIDRIGSAALIDELTLTSPDDWVVSALARSWPQYGDSALSAALRRTSKSPGPRLDQLRDIDIACGVVALADDSLHPSEVAREWCAAIPRAGYAVLPRDLAGRGPEVIGQAAMQALSESP